MNYAAFMTRLAETGVVDDPQQISFVVLEELGKRLPGQEPDLLAAQLPSELKQPLSKHVGSGESFTVSEFFRRIAERESPVVGVETAQSHAEAVLGTIASFVSGGEIADVRGQLPEEFRYLLT